MPKMTQMSRIMANKAVRIRSTAEAVAFLKDNPPMRTLKDILVAADKQQLSEMELKRMISAGICKNHPEKKKDAVDRTVRNWFSGNTRAVSRNVAFELCLILKLNVDEANHFLMRTCDEAIHWRNPVEVAWGYAFEHGLDYAQTMALIDSVKEIAPEKKRNAREDIFTNMIRRDVLECLEGSQEELLEFIAQNQELWGSFHNEAYSLFKTFMDLLEIATTDRSDYDRQKEAQEAARRNHSAEMPVVEEKLSAERILETYFFSRLLNGGEQRDSIQKSIRSNWPDETVLSKMKNRSGGVDVSRKVLILLFLATNGEDSAYRSRESDYDEDLPVTRETVFRNTYQRLNLMLSRCGFQPLDPRSPFDWVVLYCICVEDVVETDQRLSEMLAGLFSEEEAAAEEI